MGRWICLTGVLLGSGILLSALMLVAAGYYGSVQPPQDFQEITLRSSDFAFEPGRLTVRSEAPVRLTLDNTAGELVHDVTIDTVGGNGPLSRFLGPRVHVEAPPGTRASVEFVPATGAYLLYCSIYRHSLDGMVGILVVD
jgi:plastocyanin